jgi:hypothetical protein
VNWLAHAFLSRPDIEFHLGNLLADLVKGRDRSAMTPAFLEEQTVSDAATRAAVTAADNYLAALSRYRHGDDGPTDPVKVAGGPEAHRFFETLNGQSGEVRDAAANRLAAGIGSVPDPLAAALAAYQVGALIEAGADPAVLGEALRPRLQADFAAARRFVGLVEAESNIQRPGDVNPATIARLGCKERTGASAWAALKFSTCAAMAAWCRHRPSRLLARSAPGLAEDASFLGGRGGYCYFIAELLSAADGTQITVLAPEQHRGFLIELDSVRNAAHLFALLEDTVVGDPEQGWLAGPRVDAKVAAVARGEGLIEEGMSYQVGWHYEYWWGLHPSGAARRRNVHPLVAGMIGVEATVHDLPEFRGQAILLMRPKLLGSRLCDISFFAPLHDALRSRVTVLRKLPAVEVDSLCQDLRAEAEKL